MKKMGIPILILALAALYSITPFLLRPEFPFGGDIHIHLNWAKQVSMGIREGIIYPRWLAESNNGYGSPTTIFYSPLFYLLTGIINLFIPSLIVSLKVVTFTGFLLSGISIYLFLRNFCGNTASVAGGIVYQLMPYHAFGLYAKGALAETFAFAWLPLILYFTYKGFKEDSLSTWIGLALSYAGLIITHIVSAYIFTFVMTLFALSLFLKEKDFKVLLRFIVAFLFGLCLAAIYFIPMVFERGFVHIEWLTELSILDYRNNFLFMGQGSKDTFYTNLEQIVALQVSLALISLLLIYHHGREYEDTSRTLQLVFFFFVFAFSIFVSTPYSMPIWRIVPGLPTIQFPWRWLMLSTLSVSVLAGMAFDLFSLKEIKNDRFARVFSAVFYAIIASNLYLASFYLLTAEPVKKDKIKWMLKSGGDVPEYRPIWLTQTTKDLSKEKWIPVSFKEGAGKVDIITWKSQTRLFTVNAAIPSTVRISTFYYPGWTASIKGIELPIGIEKDSGAMLLNIQPGRSEVLLEFRDTPLRRTAKWISILSLFTALIGLIAGRLKKPLKS